MTEQELIEALWSRWMQYLFSKCEDPYCVNADGFDVYVGKVIPPEQVARWKRQIETGYHALTDTEKQSDRDEVAHILPIIEAYKSNEGKDISVDKDFFEHLLNCMCNQKYLPTLDRPMSDREKHDQEVIDKAYHEARDLLMQGVLHD